MNYKSIIFFTIIFFQITVSCSTKEESINIDQESFYGVGKWKIRKKGGSAGSKKESCNVTDLILNSNLTFKIYTSDNNVLIGTYKIVSDESLEMYDTEGIVVGSLNNIQITNSIITFEIDLTNVCNDVLEGEKDESYQEDKTYIADVEFEKYLIELGLDDEIDGFVPTSNINSLEQIFATERGIKSLVGIEDFKNLNSLVASNNYISGVLDLSFNKQLAYVDLPFNPLEEIYFKNNISLEGVFIYGTYTLEVLEIANSPNLKQLAVHDTKLKKLDLSNSPIIEHIRIWDSKLTELDLSNQSSLKYLYAYNIFDHNNPSLILPNTDSLEMIWLDRNKIDFLDLSENQNLKVVSCQDCELGEIILPESNSLYALLLNRNELTELDLSKNPNLRILRAESNLLNCISVNPNLINNIPPGCEEANIPLNYDDNPNLSCDNPWNVVDFPFSEDAANYPDSWMYDPSVIFSLSCN